MWIIDQSYICSAARKFTTNANSIVFPANISVPFGCCLAILGKSYTWKYLVIGRLVVDQITHATAKARCQTLSVADLNDLLLWKFSQKPSREQKARELRLTVTRRNRDRQPFNFAFRDLLEGFGHDHMVSAFDKLRPYLFYKWEEMLSSFVLFPKRIAFFEQLKNTCFLYRIQRVEITFQLS